MGGFNLLHSSTYEKLSSSEKGPNMFFRLILIALTLGFGFQTQVAADWNNSKPKKIEDIPPFALDNFSPAQKVITSVQDRDYSFCSSNNLDWTGAEIWNLEKFKEKYEDYFSADYVETFENTETGKLIAGKEVYSSFEDGLIQYTFEMQGQHHRCLHNQDKTSCGKLIEITSDLANSNAATKPSSNIKNTDIPFTTIQKFLIPTIIGYSTAVQVLGVPENHKEIGEWFNATFNANVLDTKTGRGIDLFRDKSALKPEKKKFGCFLAAQNHSLQSGFLYMAHSAIWGDIEQLLIGIDQLQLTLKSIRPDGALPCEVARGPNSLFYSGATIHTMLQMLHLMSLNGIKYEEFIDLESLHRAASFQFESGIKPKNLEKYTKTFKENVWCKPYKGTSGQCMYQRPKRNVSFGWIQLYIKLFPNHENTKLINATFEKFQTEVLLDPIKKLNLNAIFQPNQTKSTLKNNYEDIVEPWETNGRKEDGSMIHFNDTSDWGRGSPLCLYGLSSDFSAK